MNKYNNVGIILYPKINVKYICNISVCTLLLLILKQFKLYYFHDLPIKLLTITKITVTDLVKIQKLRSLKIGHDLFYILLNRIIPSTCVHIQGI